MFFLICMLPVCIASANDGKYIQTMTKNIQAIYEAQEPSRMQEVVNTFERIASAEKDKWEPLYYIAYGNIMLANMDEDGQRKDAFLDTALEHIKKAKEIVADESELVALEGFVSMLRITVDPQARGPVHAPIAMQLFNKAAALNPKNPRALALLAQMQFGTAQFFNSPTTEACGTNARALEAFSRAQTDNPLTPAWGRQMAEGLAAQCKD